MALAIITQHNFSVKPSSFHPSLPKIFKKIQPSFYTKPLHLHCSLNKLYKSNPIPQTTSIPWNFNLPIETIGLLMGVFYPDMPSTDALLSAMTLIASQVLLPALLDKYVSPQFHCHVLSTLRSLFDNTSSKLTLVIYECNENSPNQIYEASKIYLRNKISPSAERLIVSKLENENNISVTMEEEDDIVEEFEGIPLKWKSICLHSQTPDSDAPHWHKPLENRCFELSFNKKYKEKVLGFYLPYILSKSKSKSLKKEEHVVKIHTLGCYGTGWKSISIDHPTTFDTGVLMDHELKKELMEDLEMFVNKKESYKNTGKAWKSGYLLYGPHESGKSNLITAMANYLNYDIYELELMGFQSNSEIENLLRDTGNRSILVFKDIDCGVELQDQKCGSGGLAKYNQLTPSDLMNFIDGLWPYDDERIIVVTTNNKEWLDPALLSLSGMDMHIHKSYCTPTGLKVLAFNYHKIQGNQLFRELEGLMEKVDITLAEVCDELTRNNDADISLHGLVEFLRKKKMDSDAAKDEERT